MASQQTDSEIKIDESDLLDGHSGVQVFRNPASCSGLTYDDLILMPGMLRTPCLIFFISKSRTM